MNKVQTDLLKILSTSLFANEAVCNYSGDTEELLKEALSQAVYPLVQMKISKNFDSRCLSIISGNMQSIHEHQELHALMKDIPYVILKGCASAHYYPDPVLRMMGDVDFLVAESDFEKTGSVLLNQGFVAEEDHGGIHVGFQKEPHSSFELHRCINGSNDKIDKYLSDILDKACYINGMMMPSEFHHCLILLCHTASHLISEGVGLRHLCDWAVFVNKVDVSAYEKELKDCGLYRFAQTLSLTASKYLGLPYQDWFGLDTADLCEPLIEDIMAGGNFGKKDDDRYRQIKYIKDRGDGSVGKDNGFLQLFDSIKKKSLATNRSVAGVIFDYALMVIKGERKADGISTIKTASLRKELYKRMEIYDSH